MEGPLESLGFGRGVWEQELALPFSHKHRRQCKGLNKWDQACSGWHGCNRPGDKQIHSVFSSPTLYSLNPTIRDSTRQCRWWNQLDRLPGHRAGQQSLKNLLERKTTKCKVDKQFPTPPSLSIDYQTLHLTFSSPSIMSSSWIWSICPDHVLGNCFWKSLPSKLPKSSVPSASQVCVCAVVCACMCVYVCWVYVHVCFQTWAAERRKNILCIVSGEGRHPNTASPFSIPMFFTLSRNCFGRKIGKIANYFLPKARYSFKRIWNTEFIISVTWLSQKRSGGYPLALSGYQVLPSINSPSHPMLLEWVFVSSAWQFAFLTSWCFCWCWPKRQIWRHGTKWLELSNKQRCLTKQGLPQGLFRRAPPQSPHPRLPHNPPSQAKPSHLTTALLFCMATLFCLWMLVWPTTSLSCLILKWTYTPPKKNPVGLLNNGFNTFSVF